MILNEANTKQYKIVDANIICDFNYFSLQSWGKKIVITRNQKDNTQIIKQCELIKVGTEISEANKIMKGIGKAEHSITTLLSV